MTHLKLPPAVRMAVAAAALAASFPGAGWGQTAESSAPSRTAIEDSWKVGRQWLSLRVGHARSAVEGAANGNFGYGIGYGRRLSGLKLGRYRAFGNTSANVHLQYDVLGRYGDAAEIEVPLTLEVLQHYHWAPGVHPYAGLGVGAYYRKLYRTHRDFHTTRGGVHFALGANTPLDDHRVLGLDVRLARVNAENDGVNPVFGPGDRKATHWSIMINYAITY